jgi:hypothetical protein
VRRRRHVTSVLAVACLLAASIAGPAAAQTKDKALVRLAHFAENVAVGDIYVVFVDGRQKFNDVPYKTVSDYLPLKPGTYKIEVRPARAPSTAPAEAQLSVSVEAGRAYTVGVWGEGTTVSAMVLNDDLDPAPSGKVRVRAINAIAGKDGQPVDLLSSGKVIIDGANPTGASEYVDVSAGRVPLSFRTPDGKTIASTTARLESGGVVSVAAIGGSGRDPEMLVANDAVGMSSTPSGGVATGGGGTAPAETPAWLLPLVAAGALGAAGLALAGRRRRA